MPYKVEGNLLTYVEPAKSVSRKSIEWFADQLYRPTGQPSDQLPLASSDNKIKIICISDTHCLKPDVPAGDILLHAGDLSNRGTFAEIQAQLDWLNTQPHEHKIVIGGNHDIILDDEALQRKSKKRSDDFPPDGKRKEDLQWGSLVYLNGECITLTISACQRRVKLFGSPLTPAYGDWAFQYPPEHNVWHGQIPEDVDIVMTHGPLRGHLDPGHLGRAAGCPHLLREIRRVQPKVHVFGHIHEGRGQEVLVTDEASDAYERVKVHGEGVNALVDLIRAKSKSGKKPGSQTLLVNAAVVKKPPYMETLSATVVDI